MNDRWAAVRRQSATVDRASRAVAHYRAAGVEFAALKVITRGLFLAVSAMMVFLYFFSLITSVAPGINEIAIPTMTLPDQTDLGASVQTLFTETRGTVTRAVGWVTLFLSAALTGAALRRGTRAALASSVSQAEHIARRSARTVLGDLGIGLAIAALVMITWIGALVTAIRARVLTTWAGGDLSMATIAGGKIVVILAMWALVFGAVCVTLRRRVPDDRRRELRRAAALFAGFVTAANFVMLYAYVAALIDPNTSGGIVLVLTLLTWINVVVRGLFLTQSWLAG